MHDLGHNVYTVGNHNDVNSPSSLKLLRELGPDLFIVAGFPQIFRKEILSIPKYGAWNCHAGPVPEYRGGSPLNWQIIDGKEKIGISLLLMDEGIDTGPLIAAREFFLSKEETISEAHWKANHLFADMVEQALNEFPPVVMQQPISSLYRKQRKDDDGEINPAWDKARALNFIRALNHPYPGAWIRLDNGERLRIWEAS